jgi:predicted Rossmann-fold nucleotide-binding protein
MTRSSTLKIKNICGSSPEKENEVLESTNYLGRVVAERKTHLIYGGGNFGSIENVSIVVFFVDNQVLGINPKALANENITRKTIGDELKVLTRSERIATILEHFDAFISLPISLGTFKEIFQIFSTPN